MTNIKMMRAETTDPAVQRKMETKVETEINNDNSAEHKEYVDDLFQNHRYVWSLLLFGEGSGGIVSRET